MKKFYFNSFGAAVVFDEDNGCRGIYDRNRSGSIPDVKQDHVKNDNGSITVRTYKVVLVKEETFTEVIK